MHLFFYLANRMTEIQIICACCRSRTSPPQGKRRFDFFLCSCPISPSICGSCRNRRYTNYTCSWCGSIALARSTRSSQKASYLKSVAKRWETFRTDYPFLSALSENWCNFAHYDKWMQGIQSFAHSLFAD